MIPIRDDNPTRTPPILTWLVIGLCVLVFLWEWSLGAAAQQAIFGYGLIPARLLQGAMLPPEIGTVPAVLTVFTSMFLHGGWMHLIGNMLYLWIFSDNVEDAMGHGRFLVFYLLCGIGAALAQALPAPASTVPMVGASGAISGVLGAYLVLYPNARVTVVIPLGFYLHVTRLPAVAVLGLWFLMQLLSELLSGAGSGVAFRAHIGGFVAGLVLVFAFLPRRR
ncbi:rhomboid family intramembrane serine protease [uncultured Abyssibacter sp.]|uniref:rhomboid family intramembrane serine protease n=1 Tax=uncultured Abyssibacter sp. TaxID=2320202 RepID=UPI0032B259AA